MEHPKIKPDLSGADLSGTNLVGIDLSQCDLTECQFNDTNLTGSLLFASDMTGANLWRANLWNSNCEGAKLRGADLREANLREAWFESADLTEANLSGAILIETNFEKATLQGCNVFGCSSWNVNLLGTNQRDLVIWRGSLDYDDESEVNPYELKDEFPLEYVQKIAEPSITVDDLRVAQFLYLIIANQEIRYVIDTLTSKVVLILGRFTIEQKKILDAIRDNIRKHNFVPILFDFPGPKNRDLTETIELLARMARYIVVDLTDPSSVPHELATIVPLVSVPVISILHEKTKEYGMFHTLLKFPWVMKPFHYSNERHLIENLELMILGPAEEKARELIKARGEARG